MASGMPKELAETWWNFDMGGAFDAVPLAL